MFNTSKALRDDLEKAQRELRELGDSFASYKRAQALEYEELLDKVRRWMQRTGARERVEAKAGHVEQFSGLAPGPDPVSARILARRARAGGVPGQLSMVRGEDDPA